LKYLKTFSSSRKNCHVNWFGSKLGMRTSRGYYESDIVINRGNMDIEICLNGDYMEEALSQFKDKVTIYVGSDKSPLILRSETDADNTALVLPVKLRDRLFQA